MPFQAVPNTARVVLNYLWNGFPCANVLHFTQSGGPPSTTDLADAADVMGDQWVGAMAPLVSTQVTLVNVVATNLSVEGGAQVTDAVGISGGNVNASEARNVTFCITFNSSLSGRSNRGRLYLVGLTENVVTNSTIALATADAFVDALIDMMQGVEAATGMSHVIVSRFTGGAPRPAGLPVLVTSIGYSDLTTDSQRGRLR